MNNNLKAGLRPTPHDHRDFPLADDPSRKLGGLVTLPKLEELPERFVLEPLSLKDQGESDFCTAFASTLLSEMQEGVVLSPEYSFALGKLLSRDPDEWGQDIRKALKAHVKIGAIEQSDAPFSLENKDQDFLRRFMNWPDTLLQKTALHRKQSFAEITGPYDHYDNIRASIWKFQKEKRGVISGVNWSWPLDEFILGGISDEGFGHCIPFIGWDKDGLIVQNSVGERAGMKGRHLMDRDTINHFVSKYEAFMLIDMNPEDAQYYLDNGIKLDDNWVVGIFKAIASLFSLTLKRISSHS